MKKKILIVCLLIALVLVPATAASYRGASKNNTLGVGLNLGTNTGVGFKAGLGKFDIIADVGFGLLNFDLSVDAAAMYEVADIDIKGPHHLPITAGGGANFGFDLENGDTNIGIFGMAGIEYTLPDFPMNFYFRLGLGANLEIAGGNLTPSFGWAANLGALYVFDI